MAPPASPPTVRVRAAQPRDIADIHRLIVALAEYEQDPASCTSTPEDLRIALFPDDREAAAFALVAEMAPTAGAETSYRVVGMAVWFLSFSTWTGRHGIWLEDLYVEPAHRGGGLGTALLAGLARICRDRGYPRLEWWVLDWNRPSIEFYESLGATAQDAWTTYRMDGAALTRLAALDSLPE